jgi:hypothetical protein
MGIGPAGAYCAALDEDAQHVLKVSLWERLGTPTGPFSLQARAWFVRGTA